MITVSLRLSVIAVLFEQFLGQEPEPPSLPSNTYLAVFLIPVLVLIGFVVLVYKLKTGRMELVAVSLSAVTGFLLGLILTGYANIGLAQLGAIIGITLSSAVLAIGKALRKYFRS